MVFVCDVISKNTVLPCQALGVGYPQGSGAHLSQSCDLGQPDRMVHSMGKVGMADVLKSQGLLLRDCLLLTEEKHTT